MQRLGQRKHRAEVGAGLAAVGARAGVVIDSLAGVAERVGSFDEAILGIVNVGAGVGLDQLQPWEDGLQRLDRDLVHRGPRVRVAPEELDVLADRPVVADTVPVRVVPRVLELIHRGLGVARAGVRGERVDVGALREHRRRLDRRGDVATQLTAVLLPDPDLVERQVGGIPDVFGPQASRLVAPGNAAALAAAIKTALADPAALRNETLTLRARVQAEFSADVMTDAILAAYGEAMARFRARA